VAKFSLLSTVSSAIGALQKASVPVTNVPAYAVNGSSWLGPIRESYAGAWQSNVIADPQHSLLAFSAVYACVTLIADDISKLRLKLVAFSEGVWQETTNAAFSPVLRKPNQYQTRIQFINQWVQSKLLYGNTYVLKVRDNRGIVVQMFILDPRLVKALVADDGSVFYECGMNRLTGTQNSITVPASEVIHDRAICFFHPLIGVGPIYACAISATQGGRIQTNSAKFFDNMSRPSGHLTAAGTISDETSARLKAHFESNFSGGNLGRLLVTGDGLKYEPMTIPAQQAQLIEQLRWTVEDVARCFHVPLHKIASDSGIKYANMAQMNQDYYSQTLQVLIENIELLLDEGLGLTGGPQTLGIELDLDGLLRMDPLQIAQKNQIELDAGYLAPDEARRSVNLPPVEGGKTPYMQQQKFPIAALAKQPIPGSVPPPSPAPAALPAEPTPAPVKSIEASADDEVSDEVRDLAVDLIARFARECSGA
jgi:HK97 family phage portal protein